MLAACSSVAPIPNLRTANALSWRQKRSTKCVDNDDICKVVTVSCRLTATSQEILLLPPAISQMPDAIQTG